MSKTSVSPFGLMSTSDQVVSSVSIVMVDQSPGGAFTSHLGFSSLFSFFALPPDLLCAAFEARRCRVGAAEGEAHEGGEAIRTATVRTTRIF